jgi:hypothetical protein
MIFVRRIMHYLVTIYEIEQERLKTTLESTKEKDRRQPRISRFS